MVKGYIARLPGVELIYGRDGEHDTLYLARLKLTPSTRWGGLYLHIFFRGDADPDPHDHPWAFTTLPLRGYFESVMNFKGASSMQYVPPWRRTFRHANHTHRVVAWHGWGPLITFVWHKPASQKWGFFVGPESDLYFMGSQIYTRGQKRKVHWRDYVYGSAEVEKWKRGLSIAREE